MQIGLGIGTTFRQKWVPPLMEQIRSRLFGSGEQGAWYDPSDMSTLFQDAAGTTPVTAVEQPVGLMLDLSGRGNHATQATTTKRPVLSRRVNLLTKSGQFDDAGWDKGRVVVVSEGSEEAGFRMIPNNQNTTHLLQKLVAVAQNTTYKLSIKAKKAGYRYFYFAQLGGPTTGSMFDFDTGTYGTTTGTGTTYSAELLADGSWLLGMTFTTGPGVTTITLEACSTPLPIFNTFAGDAVSGVVIKDASLTLATDAHLPYQRVNTATDYDTDPSKFPAYLRFDGVDDAMQTGNIDFTGTDKMTVWAGVTKIGDAVRNPIIEVGGYGVAQGFGLYSSPQGTTNQMQAFHAAANPVYVYAAATPPNANYVLGLQSDLSAPKIAMRRSGAAAAESTASPGVGAYGNLPASIGSGTTGGFYFNGRLYSLIVRGAQTQLSQIEATELYIKQKMRMP